MARCNISFRVVATAGSILVACAPPQPEQADAPSFSAADEAAVRQNLTTYIETDPVSDPDAFFSQFTADVFWVFQGQDPWIGMDGLRAVEWCPTLAAQISAERVEGEQDLAYARGTYSLSLDCGTDEPVNIVGRFQSVHHRQDDGSWRITSLIQT